MSVKAVDRTMAEYNSWWTRGRPCREAVGFDGRTQPDLGVPTPPEGDKEEE